MPGFRRQWKSMHDFRFRQFAHESAPQKCMILQLALGSAFHNTESPLRDTNAVLPVRPHEPDNCEY